MFKKIISDSEISKTINDNIEKLVKELVKQLTNVGNQCLSEMENSQGYLSRTGNLTASKGFSVALDGEIQYTSNFNSTEGGEAGRELAESRAKETKGVSLVIVAGAKYALYVEAKGFNVITSSKLLAEEIVPKILQDL